MERRNLLSLGLLSLAATVSVHGQVLQAAAPAGLDGSPTRSTTENLAIKRYVTAGNRAYEVGTLDGAFPGMGFHIQGHMNGVWLHPIKLLDSYAVSINGTALPAANRFTSGAGYVQFNHPTTAGVTVTRTVFSPDGIPVVLIGLSLKNAGSGATAFNLSFDATSELIGAYPWTFTKPTSDEVHQADQVVFDPIFSRLRFSQPGKPWYAEVSGAPRLVTGQASAQLIAATFPARSTIQPKQAKGRLIWRVNLGSGSQLNLWIAVAGSNTGLFEANYAIFRGLLDPDGLLAAKVTSRLDALAASKATIPNATLQAAFDWAKVNLADMRRVVQDAHIRDTYDAKTATAGGAYPAPIATYPILSGFGAGYPDYPWYFGTDGAYTVFPLVAVGAFQQAKDHLNLLREVSRTVNGGTGKVIHELVTTGDIFYGTNPTPGDTNETPEFATAVATLWRWSGDNSVRDDNYQFIIDGLRYITTTLDSNGDGWPEGAGMVESATDLGAEKVDVAAYTIRALRDLAEMAGSKNDRVTQSWASGKASALTTIFDRSWYIPALGLYADSLALNKEVATDPGVVVVPGTTPITKLQGLYWTNAVPMETNLATADHAASAFPILESPIFTVPNGYVQQAFGGGPQGRGSLQASALNTSVIAVAEANYGRVNQSLAYVLDIARHLDLEQPGALPELMPSPDYDSFQIFTQRAMVMQAWSSYGVVYPVVYHYLGVRPNAPRHTLTVLPQLPDSLQSLRLSALNVGGQTVSAYATHTGNGYLTRVVVPAGYQGTIGYVIPSGTIPREVRLNGNPAAFQTRDTLRGREVYVQTFVPGTYQVDVRTR